MGLLNLALYLSVVLLVGVQCLHISKRQTSPPVVDFCNGYQGYTVDIDGQSVGVLRSPKDTSGNYYNNLKCSVKLRTQSQPLVITLSYRNFNLEMESSYCSYDGLCVNGVKFCGVWETGTNFDYVIPSYSIFTLSFTTDVSVTLSGFEILVKSRPYNGTSLTMATGGVGASLNQVVFTTVSSSYLNTYSDRCKVTNETSATSTSWLQQTVSNTATYPNYNTTSYPYYNTTSYPYYNTTSYPFYNTTSYPYYNTTSYPYYNTTSYPYYNTTRASNSTSNTTSYSYYNTTSYPYYNTTSYPYYNTTSYPYYNTTRVNNSTSNTTYYPYYNTTSYPYYNTTSYPYYNTTSYPYYNTTSYPYYNTTRVNNSTSNTTYYPYYNTTSYPYYNTTSYPYYNTTSYPYYNTTSYPYYNTTSYPYYNTTSYPYYNTTSYPYYNTTSYPYYNTTSYPYYNTTRPSNLTSNSG